MSISFSGLASGMDTSTWVAALVDAKKATLITPLENQHKELTNQKTALSTVKSEYSSLLSATQTFTDAKFGTTMDLFAKNVVSSSNDKIISATVTNSTPRQTINLQVLQMATKTKASSQNAIGAKINEETKISSLVSGSVKEGTMSLYVDGKRFEIEVAKEDTLGTIATKLKDTAVDENGNSLIDVTFEDGKFTITANNGEEVRIGANSDTSTLASALALKSQENGSVQSSYSIGGINLNAPLTSVDSGFYTTNENGEKIPQITEGTFTIGDAEFTIDSTTTMNQLISKINASQSAKAGIFYDSVQNKIVLTSKQDGAFNINIEGGTSNITDILGLTQDGNIIPETQELGQNAQININGSVIESFSNTITSEVTGIAGLTLDLKNVTAEDETINITIGQDFDTITKEIEELVNTINSFISISDQATQSGSYLQYDSSLNSFRNEVRMIGSYAVDSDSMYKTLASIGITTGEVGTSVEAETNSFKIDKEKLKEALTNDPEAVKILFVGDSEAGIDGVATKLQDIMNRALNADNGFFNNREKTITSQISSVEARITSKTTFLNSYEEQMEEKFQNMEKQIAKLQEMQNQMSSIISV